MPSDEEVSHFKRYYPESNLMHWYNKGYADALREVRRDVGRDFGTSRPMVESRVGEFGIEAKPKRRKKNGWVTFLKKFKFRNRRRNESSRDYLAMRTRSASRAWKKSKRNKR